MDSLGLEVLQELLEQQELQVKVAHQDLLDLLGNQDHKAQLDRKENKDHQDLLALVVYKVTEVT